MEPQHLGVMLIEVIDVIEATGIEAPRWRC
jgi:hypothetical protein